MPIINPNPAGSLASISNAIIAVGNGITSTVTSISNTTQLFSGFVDNKIREQKYTSDEDFETFKQEHLTITTVRRKTAQAGLTNAYSNHLNYMDSLDLHADTLAAMQADGHNIVSK